MMCKTLGYSYKDTAIISALILNDFYHKESSLFLKAEFIFNFKHKKKEPDMQTLNKI